MLIGLFVLALGGLAGFYFYLHTQSQEMPASGVSPRTAVGAPSFGSPTGSTQANQAIATQSLGTSGSQSTSTSALWQADKAPVAGMGFVNTDAGEKIYFIERANGYVFGADPAARAVIRITDTLMPKIAVAQFANNGYFIEQTIDASGAIATFLGHVASSSATSTGATTVSNVQGQLSEVAGNYIEPDIRAIALDRVTRSLFYLISDPHGGVAGISMEWNGLKRHQAFASIIGSWRPFALDDGSIVLLESPADGVPGYAYSLSSGGSLRALVQNVPGLTILPKSGSSSLIFGSSSGSGLSLFARSTGAPTATPFQTTADKCVWLPGASQIVYCAIPNGTISGKYLNAHYKGIGATSDDWWRLDLTTGATQRIYSPSADNVSLDVENPIMDESGNYISFLNAYDHSLWVLRVSQ